MSDIGYLNWDRRHYRGPVFLAGEAIGVSLLWHPQVVRPGGGFSIPMADGSSITQLVLTDPERPASLRPLSIDLTLGALRVEEERDRFLEAQAQGFPVRLFWGLWATDAWYVPAAPTTQTLWRTSRRTPWELTGISRGLATPNYDPVAKLDGVDLTVVTSSPPSAGEVTVPVSNVAGSYTEIETVAGIGGAHLSLYYPCEPLVEIVEVSEAVEVANVMQFTIRAEERIGA